MTPRGCFAKASLFFGATFMVCCLAWSGNLALADYPFDCYGSGMQNLSIPSKSHYDLPGDREYANVTIGTSATLDLNGHTLRVRGRLTNYGWITDSACGGNGGVGGTGATGGGGAFPLQYPPGYCAPGGDGGDPNCSGAGQGGRGGGGGGGGAGGWNTTLGCWVEGAVSGGAGGNGGAGGRGGGRVRMFVYELDNHGTIAADGQSGGNGQPGTQGDYIEYFCVSVWRDATGGGGGGGGGGDGGNGGRIEVTYAVLVNEGLIHANHGHGGQGGARGGSQCESLIYPAGPGQQWEYGSPGCPPGNGGCGYGGYGGESDRGVICGDTAHGQPGFDGCDGDDGVVILMRDCNCNGVPDEQEPDCNANGVVDACDIASELSEDCNSNSIPDECELAAHDCNENEIPDDCDIASGYSEDCNSNGIPDNCDLAAGTSCDFDGDAVPDDCDARYCRGDVNCDGTVGFGDINPFVLLLSDPPAWQAAYPDCPVANGDINRDCSVNFGDISPFVSLLSTNPIPQCD